MTLNRLSLTREQEIIRLFELKLIPDQFRTVKQQVEMDRLNQLHKPYSMMSANEMKKRLIGKLSSVVLAIQSPGNSGQVSHDYQTTFATKLGYPKPQQKNGLVVVAFKSEIDALDFVLRQASTGRKFKVLNAQNRIVAMSNGKGMLQHADGRPFNPSNLYSTFLSALQNQNQNQNQIRNQVTAVTPKPTMIPSQTQQRVARAKVAVANPQVGVVSPKVAVPSPQVAPTVRRPIMKPVMTTGEDLNKKAPYPTPFKKTPYEH